MNDNLTERADPVIELRDTVPDRRFLLRIADLTVEVTCDEGIFNPGVEGSKEKFIVNEGAPDVRIRAAFSELSKEVNYHKLFDAGIVWQLYQHNGSYVFRFGSLAFGICPYKIAIFNPDFSFGDVYLDRDFFHAGKPVDPLWHPLDELLYSNLLARGKGTEVHACGLIDPEGLGHLFVGRSGAGKTTMARLWQDMPGVRILSDDRVILRRSGEKIWMYGTPWHGEGGMAIASKALLSRIYFLQKGLSNELLPQKEADAAARLTACAFPPFYNREAMDFTLCFLSDVAKEVICYDLRVKPDKRVVEYIRTKGRTEA